MNNGVLIEWLSIKFLKNQVLIKKSILGVFTVVLVIQNDFVQSEMKWFISF